MLWAVFALDKNGWKEYLLSPTKELAGYAKRICTSINFIAGNCKMKG